MSAKTRRWLTSERSVEIEVSSTRDMANSVCIAALPIIEVRATSHTTVDTPSASAAKLIGTIGGSVRSDMVR